MAPIRYLLSRYLVLVVQVSKVAELDKWQLYLVDWGYNTEAERQRADADPRITLLTKEAFLALTKEC